jgi:tetratricopeptide (TPR) repeat protein
MKKKYLIPFLLFFSFSSKLYSQKFISNIEKQSINEYEKDSLNYDFLKNICAIDSTLTTKKFNSYKEQLNVIISSLPPKEEKDSREKKRVKKIYNTIHNKFFQKYDLKAEFTDVFKNGTYNCVSVTALYVYVFEKLNIPYHIKELPTHVFLIAYPQTLKIHLETTVPGAYGFYSPNDSEVKKIVDELVEVKLVSKLELQEKGFSKVYQDYFYGKKFVDKKSLIGMQYFNKSVFCLEDKDFKRAYTNISKSLKYYKSPLSKRLSVQLVLMNLSELEIENEEALELLYNNLSLLKYKKDIDIYAVRELLYKITSNNKNEFIEKAALKLSFLKDEQLKDFIQTELYDYLSRSEANKRNLDKAIEYSDILLGLNSNNKRAKEVLLNCIPSKISLMPINDKSLNELEEYIKKYDFLIGDKRIDTIRAMLYGQLTQLKFSERKPKEGLEYLNSFENIMDNQRENIQIIPSAIAQLYLIVGRYYYGKSQFKSAIKHFQKGVEYIPENIDLKKMLKWAKEDLH